MSWRYRKSISLFPGVKLNLNGKSASISVGTRGLHTTLNTKGTVTNSFGIPGTGLSYRTTNKIDLKSSSSRNTPCNNDIRQPQSVQINDTNMQERKQIEFTIRSIYGKNIGKLDWLSVLRKPLTSDSPDEFKEIKSISHRVLSGDTESYGQALNLFHPFSEILAFGCKLEFNAINSDTVSFHFLVNSQQALPRLSTFTPQVRNTLLQDFICGIALSIARDAFYLLPVKTIYIDAEDYDMDILSVCFDIETFATLDLETVDASNSILLFRHEMSWSIQNGFSPIIFLDAQLM